MKKLLLIIMFLGLSVFFFTCMRNDLYKNAEDNTLSILKLMSGTNDPPAEPAEPAEPAPEAIYIYSYGAHNGYLVDRASADNLCATSAARPAGTRAAHAFLSFSSSNIIDLVPSAYLDLPVRNSTGTILISDSWTDMWDGSLNCSFYDAGVLPNTAYWWSASGGGGTYSAPSCGDWTSTTFGETGIVGYSGSTTSWIQYATWDCTIPTPYLLCLAY